MAKDQKKKKKVSFTKKQINKNKRIQSKIKAKASERKRKKLARGNVNIPRKYKFKFTSKRVSHNGGAHSLLQLPRERTAFIYIFSNSLKVEGEFSIKIMIRLATRLQKRRKKIKKLLRRRRNYRFISKQKSYQRYIRAFVSYSERALGLRLGRGKGKLGGWRIPLKPNQLLYYGTLLLNHGKNNIIKKTTNKMAQPSLFVSGSTDNKAINYVPR